MFKLLVGLLGIRVTMGRTGVGLSITHEPEPAVMLKYEFAGAKAKNFYALRSLCVNMAHKNWRVDTDLDTVGIDREPYTSGSFSSGFEQKIITSGLMVVYGPSCNTGSNCSECSFSTNIASTVNKCTDVGVTNMQHEQDYVVFNTKTQPWACEYNFDTDRCLYPSPGSTLSNLHWFPQWGKCFEHKYDKVIGASSVPSAFEYYSDTRAEIGSTAPWSAPYGKRPTSSGCPEGTFFFEPTTAKVVPSGGGSSEFVTVYPELDQFIQFPPSSSSSAATKTNEWEAYNAQCLPCPIGT